MQLSFCKFILHHKWQSRYPLVTNWTKIMLDFCFLFQFRDKTTGTNIPKNFIPAIKKSFEECCLRGHLSGHKVVGIRFVLEVGCLDSFLKFSCLYAHNLQVSVRFKLYQFKISRYNHRWISLLHMHVRVLGKEDLWPTRPIGMLMGKLLQLYQK